MTLKPVKVLVIRPDATFDVRTIKPDLPTLQELVGGYIQAVTTSQAVIWCNEEGKLRKAPFNRTATYLWWLLNPAAEGKDILQGCVFVTGPLDRHGNMTHIPDDVLNEYGRIEGIRRDRQGPWATMSTP